METSDKEINWNKLMIQISLIVIGLAALGFIIWWFYDDWKDSKDTEGAIELADNIEIPSDDEMLKWVKDIPISKRASVLADLKKMDLIGLTKQLIASYGYADDNEEQVYGVFKIIRTQLRLAFFADFFKNWNQIGKPKGETLFQFLNFLNAEEMNIVNSIVIKYPKY